jgi:hypothetical protein
LKRVLVLLMLCAVFVTALPLVPGHAFAAGPEKSQSSVRELSGRVTTTAHTPLADAVVYLKNTKTLVVRTFITGGDGQYRFPALAQNVDYQVYAEFQGKRSEVRTLSSFDSRPQAFINLKIETK